MARQEDECLLSGDGDWGPQAKACVSEGIVGYVAVENQDRRSRHMAMLEGKLATITVASAGIDRAIG